MCPRHLKSVSSLLCRFTKIDCGFANSFSSFSTVVARLKLVTNCGRQNLVYSLNADSDSLLIIALTLTASGAFGATQSIANCARLSHSLMRDLSSVASKDGTSGSAGIVAAPC
ncbi:hypothetical protein GPALN_010287 [Globodera pallida]|nr:hypothetical protein GPALN_010287 [Globodera pallida]